MPRFKWLHLSDIHVGQHSQPWLWPRFDRIFLEDLEATHAKTGGIDLVVFSGDLVQKGSPHEFDQFSEIIQRIIERLGQLGNRPKLITVPGNHDLSRSDELDPEYIAFEQFFTKRMLSDRLWDADDHRYIDFLRERFSNYTSWQQKVISGGIHLQPHTTGRLPGDATYLIEGSDCTAGFVCLNSTWLQLGSGGYEGKLHVDIRQLLAITNNNPDSWAAANDLNVLVTHQPYAWLHEISKATWNNDINPPGRYDLHIYGHMHEPVARMESEGGGLPRLHSQAASLFGLETYGDGTSRRIQGYSSNLVEIDGQDRVFKCWPRRLISTSSGLRKLAQDLTQDISEETGNFSYAYKLTKSASFQYHETLSDQNQSDNATSSSLGTTINLTRFPGEVVQSNVRRLEQHKCLGSLRDCRRVWIASDWGMGDDNFLGAVLFQLGINADSVFTIDTEGYSDRTTLFDQVQRTYGVSFASLVDSASTGQSFAIIIDDVDFMRSNLSASDREVDLEHLSEIVADFASQAHIFIKCRGLPRVAKLPVVELRSLDEADLATYLRESKLANGRFANPDAVSTLFRHTDGIPARVDSAIRDLELISLGELVVSNPDLGGIGGSAINAPRGLITTVEDLRRSEDRADRRSSDLLLALSSLPQGERLSRIRRFLGTHPFFPAHARALLERGLIATIERPSTLDGVNEAATKSLIVPRIVRDYIRETSNSEEIARTDRRALELYFGETWAEGDVSRSPAGKRARNALCPAHEIENSIALIVRTARNALFGGTPLDRERSLRLGTAFISCLIKGDHFRSAASLAQDYIEVLLECGDVDRELTRFRYEQARCLRMTGSFREAKLLFQTLNTSLLKPTQRQNAEVGLALCLEASGDYQGAIKAAEKAIEVDDRTKLAIQAKTIIASHISDPSRREIDLRRLLSEAKQQSATTAATNILLELAKDSAKSQTDRSELLREAISVSESSNEFYNGARAIIQLAESTDATNNLNETDQERLRAAYHFLFNERLSNLFDKCHDTLWMTFEINRDVENLLNLFRQSSFIWRLNGRAAQEEKYLRRLQTLARDLVAQDVRLASRDGAYFVIRVTIILGS